jgi:hypothetical protein
LTVTFDSNVWEAFVSEPSGYPIIRKRILDGSVSPYLCQISISLESIRKSDRQEFFPNYRPNINLTWKSKGDGSYQGTLQIGPNTESHPGLAQVLLDRVLKARKIGFKVLPMINLGTVRSSEMPQDMLVKMESSDAYWE